MDGQVGLGWDRRARIKRSGKKEGREMVSRGKGLPPPLKKDKRISAQAQVVFLPDGCAHYTRNPRLGACRLVWAAGKIVFFFFLPWGPSCVRLPLCCGGL